MQLTGFLNSCAVIVWWISWSMFLKLDSQTEVVLNENRGYIIDDVLSL